MTDVNNPAELSALLKRIAVSGSYDAAQYSRELADALTAITKSTTPISSDEESKLFSKKFPAYENEGTIYSSEIIAHPIKPIDLASHQKKGSP